MKQTLLAKLFLIRTQRQSIKRHSRLFHYDIWNGENKCWNIIYHFYNATYITVDNNYKEIAAISVETFISVDFSRLNANLKFALRLIFCEKIKLNDIHQTISVKYFFSH